MLVLKLLLLLSFKCLINCESFVNSSLNDECPNIKHPLGSLRKRRHLVFPDKSSAGVVVSVTKTIMTKEPSGWYLVIEMELAYMLPDAKIISAHLRRKLHHRQKREFWDKLQSLIDFHNFDGKTCVLRSICEANMYLAPPGKSLIHDLLRAILTAPLHEENFTEEIRGTYDELLDPNFCDKVNECPVSILHFILAWNKQKNY